MQTILGAGGAIGIPLAGELRKYTDRVRLVSRNPKKVNQDDELFQADITIKENVSRAVEGSAVVYLVAGLKYDIRVWRELWPKIMDNTIDACIKHNAKLIFLDNVYMYGLVNGVMTEETPYNPCSRKGELRAQIASGLTDAYSRGELKASIARSADFYGPDIKSSAFNLLVTDKIKNGKKPAWIFNDKVKHSFTYTPDAAEAAALIGNTDGAYNQIWHLPTDINALAGEEYIRLIGKILNRDIPHSVFPKWQMRLAGMFDRTIKEIIEMSYQNEYDYIFSSHKYEKYFGKTPVPYEEGIRKIIECWKN